MVSIKRSYFKVSKKMQDSISTLKSISVDSITKYIVQSISNEKRQNLPKFNKLPPNLREAIFDHIRKEVHKLFQLDHSAILPFSSDMKKLLKEYETLESELQDIYNLESEEFFPDADIYIDQVEEKLEKIEEKILNQCVTERYLILDPYDDMHQMVIEREMKKKKKKIV